MESFPKPSGRHKNQLPGKKGAPRKGKLLDAGEFRPFAPRRVREPDNSQYPIHKRGEPMSTPK